MTLALILALTATQPPLVVIRGNVALVEDVYRAALDLPDTARADAATARLVAVKLRKFLHRSGYALATVEAFVSGVQIVVDVDEGRLDKIIFLGGGAFETLRLRLDLHIHDDVFNRPELERQLASLSHRLGLSDFAYEIVPVGNAPLPKLQLDEIEPLEQMSLGLLRPGRPYELHILVQPGAFHPGWEPEIQVDSIEGGGLGLVYHGYGLLGLDDRFNVGGRVAGAVREKLDGTESSLQFTRGIVEGAYETPRLFGFLRPSLHVRADLSDIQRADLHFESFQFTVIEAGAQALFQPLANINGVLGTGVARRLLYDIQPQVGAILPLQPDSVAESRQYAEASFEMIFDPENLRKDQHHVAYAGARVYGPAHPNDQGELFVLGRYQKMFTLGWNEFWVESRGILRSGFVLFPEEAALAEDLRGPFSNEYTRKLVSLGLEFRYSLMRDVFKLGVFHNALAYGAINRTAGIDKLAFADSFGVGVHALILDDFQLDAYFGAGFASGGKVDHGGALSIRQAY
jgi:hypothetical protein